MKRLLQLNLKPQNILFLFCFLRLSGSVTETGSLTRGRIHSSTHTAIFTSCPSPTWPHSFKKKSFFVLFCPVIEDMDPTALHLISKDSTVKLHTQPSFRETLDHSNVSAKPKSDSMKMEFHCYFPNFNSTVPGIN